MWKFHCPFWTIFTSLLGQFRWQVCGYFKGQLWGQFHRQFFSSCQSIFRQSSGKCKNYQTERIFSLVTKIWILLEVTSLQTKQLNTFFLNLEYLTVYLIQIPQIEETGVQLVRGSFVNFLQNPYFNMNLDKIFFPRTKSIVGRCKYVPRSKMD